MANLAVTPTVQSNLGSDPANLEDGLAQMWLEISRLNEMMRSDRSDIERLKTETLILRTETRELLAGIGAQL